MTFCKLFLAAALAALCSAAASADEIFPAARIKVTDGQKTWNLQIKERTSPECSSTNLRGIVYSFHAELFPNTYVVSQSKATFEAFKEIAPRFPEYAFVSVVVRNAKAAKEANALKFPTMQKEIYDYLPMFRMPIAKTPQFVQAACSDFIAAAHRNFSTTLSIGQDGKDGATRPKAIVLGVTTDSPEDIRDIVSDFHGEDAVPRYLVTKLDGTFLKAISGSGPEGIEKLAAEVGMLWILGK